MVDERTEPTWPKIKRRGRWFVVTGRHATPDSCGMASTIYPVVLLFSGMFWLGLCIGGAGEVETPTALETHVRYTIDHWLLGHSFGLLDDMKVTNQDGSIARLNNWAWFIGGVLFFFVAASLAQPLIYPLAVLIGKRSTVRVTDSQIIFYKFRFIPRRFALTPDTEIAFRVAEHEKADEYRGWYARALHVEMIYGHRAVRIATIVPHRKAEQFSVACSIAVERALLLPLEETDPA